MTPLLTFLAAGTLLGVVAVYLVHEALEYEKQYKILKNKKELQYNNSMTVYVLQGVYDYEGRSFIGVYSTREKATEAQAIFLTEEEGQFDDYVIDEREIDAKAAF